MGTDNVKQVFEKFEDKIVKQIKFSDISYSLVQENILTKDNCTEIIILPSSQQMQLCLSYIYNTLAAYERLMDSNYYL